MKAEDQANALLAILDHTQKGEELMQSLQQALELVQAISQASEQEKAAIADFIEQGHKKIDERLSSIQLIPGPQGDKGEEPTDERLISLIKPLIPEPLHGEDGKDGKDGSPDTPQQIVQKINALEDAIDPKVIKGFDKEITTRITKHGGTNFVVSRGGVKYYDLPVDGSTKTFTLPAFWRVILIVGSSAPGVFLQGTDYTVSQANSQITFTSAIDASTSLATGQTVTVMYAENN